MPSEPEGLSPETLAAERERIECSIRELRASRHVKRHRIKTWREAAAILGVDEDTLKRHRVFHGDTTIRPWFRDEEAVIAWYLALIAPKPQPSARAKPQKQPRANVGAAVDLNALGRELTRGKPH